MPDAILSIAAISGGLLVIGAILGLSDKKNFEPRWLLIAALLVILNDAMLTRVWGAFPDMVGGNWNWQGKILATLATLAIAALPMFGWRRSGLTLDQGNERKLPTYGVIAVAALLFLGLALMSPNEPVDPETLGFQLTMPGIEEELFYRGLLLLALNEALRGRWRVLGVTIGWAALLTTVLFGCAHSVSFENGALDFDLFSFLITGVPALILIWVRERTGSVLWPIILHNLANALPLLL